MSYDRMLFKETQDTADRVINDRSGFVVAGSWELSRLLRTGLLTRPLSRPNDEDSEGWSLEVLTQEETRVRTSAVKVQSRRDVVVVLEVDRRLVPDFRMPLSIPVAAVPRVHLRSKADVRELQDQFRGFTDIDLDLIEWTHAAELFADTAGGAANRSVFDAVSTSQAFQALAVGQVLHIARSLVAQERVHEPKWQWLADIYAAIDGDTRSDDDIVRFVACLAGNNVTGGGWGMATAFAAAIGSLGGSRDPGAAKIFESFASALPAPTDDAAGKTSIEWLRRVANQEELFEPNKLTDTSSKKAVNPFQRSIALLLLDPDLVRMLRYAELPKEQRPGERVLFGAALLAASLRSGRSWPDVDPPLPLDVKRDHSIRMAGALARISGNEDQARFFHGLAGTVDRPAAPDEKGDYQVFHLRGWQPPDSSVRTSLLTWRKHDPSLSTLEDVCRRIRNAVGNEDGVAGVDLKTATRSVRIRLSAAAAHPAEIVVSVVAGEPSPLIRFEGTLLMADIRGKKAQSTAFLVKLLEIGREIRCRFFADTDGPARRPVTALRFCTEQPVATLDRNEIRCHVESIRAACDQAVRRIEE